MTDLDERLAHALRDAVPDPPHSIDPEAVRARATERHPRGRKLAPILAAAAVVVVAFAVLYVVRDSSSDDGPTPPSGPNNASLEVRPLLMPAQPVTGPSRTDDPFSDITFPLPTTEAQYARLSDREQTGLVGALQGVNCTDPPRLTGSPDRVACIDQGAYAALLGPPVVTGADVTAAQPQPPSPSGGRTEWTVLVRFSAAGADSMRAWTAAHHSSAQGAPFQKGATPPCGVSAVITCSDFLAFVVGERVVSVPVTLATLDEYLQISGGLTEDAATELAEQIRP